VAARINGINAVVIAECNRTARKLTSGPVPAPIGAGRGEVYKRLNVAAREICTVQLYVVGRCSGISLKNHGSPLSINNRAVVVDVRSVGTKKFGSTNRDGVGRGAGLG
jgi:hypothetical protein